MTTYTADAYNPALPTSQNIGGYMYLELAAIKKRLNDDLGVSAPLSISIKATLDSNSNSIANIADRVTAAENWQTNWDSTWSTFTTADSQWKSTTEQSINSLQSKLATAENNIAQLQAKVTQLENAINAMPTTTSGTAAPDDATGADGDIYYRYE